MGLNEAEEELNSSDGPVAYFLSLLEKTVDKGPVTDDAVRACYAETCTRFYGPLRKGTTFRTIDGRKKKSLDGAVSASEGVENFSVQVIIFLTYSHIYCTFVIRTSTNLHSRHNYIFDLFSHLLYICNTYLY